MEQLDLAGMTPPASQGSTSRTPVLPYARTTADSYEGVGGDHVGAYGRDSGCSLSRETLSVPTANLL